MPYRLPAGGDSYTSMKAAQTLYSNGPALDLAVIEYIKAFSPVRLLYCTAC